MGSWNAEHASSSETPVGPTWPKPAHFYPCPQSHPLRQGDANRPTQLPLKLPNITLPFSTAKYFKLPQPSFTYLRTGVFW